VGAAGQAVRRQGTAGPALTGRRGRGGGSSTEWPVVARHPEVGWADAAHDVLDDVELALATIDVHLASLSPPFSSCVSCHNRLPECPSRIMPTRPAQHATPREAGQWAASAPGKRKSVVARPRTHRRPKITGDGLTPGCDNGTAVAAIDSIRVVHRVFQPRTRKSRHNPFMPTAKLYAR
jgi:hypothetical protein